MPCPRYPDRFHPESTGELVSRRHQHILSSRQESFRGIITLERIDNLIYCAT
jgi:hypothetical protein